jgi:hypothetical protein
LWRKFCDWRDLHFSAPQMLCPERFENLASPSPISAVRGSGLSEFLNGQVGCISIVGYLFEVRL